MKILRNTLSALAVILLMSGCDSIHEFPGQESTIPSDVNIRLKFECIDKEMVPYSISRSSKSDGSHHIRYIIRIMRKGEITPVVSTVIDSDATDFQGVELPVSLSRANYTVMAWADYTDGESTDDKFYITSKFPQIELQTSIRYPGKHSLKDVFASLSDLDLSSYNSDETGEVITIPMRRPLAKVVVIAQDLREYNARAQQNGQEPLSQADTRIDYRGFFPCGFDLRYLAPNGNAKTGISFTEPIEIQSQDEVILSQNFIFINGGGSYVDLGVTITDPSGAVINTTHVGSSIPITRNRTTVIRGKFLTSSYDSGIGVNPEIDGDINVSFD